VLDRSTVLLGVTPAGWTNDDVPVLGDA